MYRIMLVDDEEHIRKGLHNLIDWNACGYEIIGEACDGREALELVSALNPDLIISDIKMPEVNGLDLICQLRLDNYRGFFILVTGYADFEYARTAIRYGVKSYLLKPIDERVLVGELYSIRQELDKNTSLNLNHNKITSLSTEKLLEQFLIGITPYSELVKLLKPDSFPLNIKSMALQVILIHHTISRDNTKDITHIKDIIGEYSRDNHLYYFFSSNKTIVLLSVNNSRTNTLLFNKLQKHIQNQLNTYTEISIGKKVTSLEDLPDSYISADQLFDMQFLYGYKGLVSAENISELPQKSTNSTEELREKLIVSMEYNSLPDINQYLELFMNHFIFNQVSEMEVKTGYINLFLALNGHFLAAYPEITPPLYDKQGFIEHAYLKNSIIELNSELKSRLAYISNELEKFYPDNIIQKMIYYIECNYNKNINITTISEALHYNRTYLGRKFKKETSYYFTDYLDKIRVEKAKKLLLHNYKVYQAAEMVGYHNVDYFNSKFKKYENITPSQYKKQHKKEE